MNNITVYVLDMPEAVKGLVRPTPEGDYLIFINARYNAAQQQEIYEHEVRHLLLDHHYAEGKHIGQIELEAGDKTALLGKIKQVERSGLPLTRAIVAPAATQRPAPPAPWGAGPRAVRGAPKKAPPGW